MQFAEVVHAVFEMDISTLRRAFELSAREEGEISCQNEVHGALTVEICYSLLDDVSPMPYDLCASLGMCEGTTYARGSDRMLRNLASRK